jgi:acyl-CoA reductase-like NAD-dependent aldehyde dehydrogenase
MRAKMMLMLLNWQNNSQFGLGSGVFTGNRERGEKLALQLEAGSSFVNKLVVSDPRLPFGGIKTVVTEGNWLPGIREFEYKNDLDCLTDKITTLWAMPDRFQ